MIRAQRIIADSIKDHLIPQVSSKKTTKKMYEGKDIKKKDEFENSIEGHQDEQRRIYSRLLHKDLLDQIEAK